MASAVSVIRSAGRFGGGGCFGCFGSGFTVVSVIAFAVSVDAFAGVSALGRFCNCSSNFFGGGFTFLAAASFARCSRTTAGGPLTGCDVVDVAAGGSGTGCSFGMDFTSIRSFCCSLVFLKTSRTTRLMASSLAAVSRSIEAVVPAVLSSGVPPGYRRCAK